MTSKPRHLHPLSMLVNAIQIFWMLAVIIFVDIATDNGGRNAILQDMAHWLVLIILGVIGITLLLVVLPYVMTTYELTDKGVTLNRGVLRRQHLHVTYARIQTVQHLQWFFLKPLGLEKVQIETAARGSGHGEVVLTLVHASVGTEIERRQQAARAAAPGAQTTPVAGMDSDTDIATDNATVASTTYRLPNEDLLIFGITSLGFIPLIFLLLAVWSRVSEWIPGVEDWLANLLMHLPAISIVVLLVVIIGLGVMAEFVRILIRYWGFTLDFDGRRLQSRKGLLQTNTVTATAKRIQAVRYKQNIIRQWLSVGTAQVILASNVASKEDDKDMVIYPLVHQDHVWEQLTRYVSWLPDRIPAVTPVMTGYWALIRNALILPVIAVIPCLIWLRPWGWLSLLLLVWGGLQGQYAATRRGYVTSGRFIYLQTGRWFERELLVSPRDRVQSLTVRQSWWMVRNGLAHVQVSLRRGDGEYEVDLRYVPLAVGEAIYQWYLGDNAVDVATTAP